MRDTPKILFLMLIIFFSGIVKLEAQTTGKIAGVVMDESSNQALPGANVFIDGTSIGASTDLNGEFYMINVPPGVYTVTIQMIGYADFKVENLRVSVNRTAFIDIALKQAVLEGEAIVVQADKISTKKDQTSSIRNISSEQIDVLPVENIEGIVNLQAGVVNGHFRGGRGNEVAYMIDGVQVVEPFGGGGKSVSVETESIEEVEVITGTFNAEYGRAMSGIVNAIIKEGNNRFQGSFSSDYANYYTSYDGIFKDLKNSEINRRNDLKFQLSGPIWKDRLTFFMNVRKQDNKDYLNAIRRFNVDDFSDFSSDNPDYWYSEHNGDSSVVALSYGKYLTFMGKVTSKISDQVKLSFLYTRNDDEWRGYDHSFKYNPDGLKKNFSTTDMYLAQLNHMLSNTMFYELKVSYLDDYYGNYLFEDPTDPRYVHDVYFNNNGPGFYTGGQQKDHTRRTVKDYNIKFDFSWQLHKQHLIKTGMLYTYHDLNQEWYQIQNAYQTREEDENFFYFDFAQGKVIFPFYEPVIYPDSTVYADVYRVKPVEFSAYIQDKMEFDAMVINMGVRYDYFDPKTTYPSQLRNPANQLDFSDNPEKMSQNLDTKPQVQISPRLGLSYQLGDAAVLHFSYGHFFQMPPMYALYQNHSLRVAPSDYETTMGNSQLEAQKTVQYEIGLWQQLMAGMGLEVTVFYRDIYNLLSTKIVSTFNQIEYGLYTNKDYGNVKGLEIKFDYAAGHFYTNVNYTLQYTRGNADNPTQTFDRAGDSKDPIPTLIPMTWDQRHTLNVTAGYNTKDWGITATAYYNSGSPYTWSPLSEYRVANINLYPNNSYKRSSSSVDLNGFVHLLEIQDVSLRLNFSVYNLFDQLNEYWVNATTGRAYTAIIQPSDLASHHSDFNDYEDRIHNPSAYVPPRLVKAGLSISF